MRTASQLLYLAIFSLFSDPSHAASHNNRDGPSKSKDASPNVCDWQPGAIVSDACASFSTLDGLNEALHPYLHSITQNTDFFSHYRLNLYDKKCPYWNDESSMCGNIACAVNTLDDEADVPLIWRAHELGKLEGPTAKHPGRPEPQRQRPLEGRLGEQVGESCVVEYDDECDERDYCVPEDESASAKGVYVSLPKNPERFTGYAGPGAGQVWEAIYRENCFSKPQANGKISSDDLSPLDSFSPFQQQAAQDLKHVMKSQNLQQSFQEAIAQNSKTSLIELADLDDECLEKRVFHRVISGMHASISTHICRAHLNQTTGEWGPNLACYEERLHNHPDRISNLYFNYALMLRAVGKIRQHIKDYSFCTADPEQDALTRKMVLRLSNAVPDGSDIFDETLMFADPSSTALKEDFRNQFRNTSRIMDCVGCDKCRLWGKLQTAGYGTALKVLFEFDEKDSSNDPPLRRTELVALINTMDRLSESLDAVKTFRKMIEERDGVTPANEPEPSVPMPDLPPVASSNEDLGVDYFPEAAMLDKESAKRQQQELLKKLNMKEKRPEPSIADQFRHEFDTVMKVWFYVLKSWWYFPAKAWTIIVIELERLWDFWMGAPIRPRTWEFRAPSKEQIVRGEL